MTDWPDAKVPVPDGVHPLFLTMTTQEHYGCKEREQVTPDVPYVWVPKETFLKEIQFKGAISDFFICKKDIQDYPGDELLIVWDEEENYGQNYYLCKTPDCARRVVDDVQMVLDAKATSPEGGDGADGDGDDAAFEDNYEPPVSKPWVSQGSEAEILEERVTDTRPTFVLQLSRKRREFHSVYKFSDRDAAEDPNLQQNDCRKYNDPNFELRRKEHDRAIQAAPDTSDAKVQTTWFRPVNLGIQYEPQKMEQKKMAHLLDSPEMLEFLNNIREGYEEALQQNETIDIFQDEFAELAEEEASLGNKADSDLRESGSYNHLQHCAGRIVSFIDWQVQTKGVVAVSCAQRLNFEDRVQVAGKVHTGYILLWNFSDPIHPQFVLEAPGDVYCFRFCPNNPDLVVGGISSGQVCVWDLGEARDKAREAKALADETAEEGLQSITAQFTILSAVEQSHKRTITDLCWMPPSLEVTEKGKFVRKTVTGSGEFNQFCTVASDGQILFWDLRKAAEAQEEKLREEKTSKKEGWGPTAKLSLQHPEGSGELSCSFGILDVPDELMSPCRLFCVTEEGEFVTIQLSGPGEENFVKGVRSVIPGHSGPCTALQRSPFVPKVHLSVGDWSFTLWKEGVSSPLFASPFSACLLSCGAWSPSRPAVIFIGKADGNIDIWDLLDRSHEPSMTVNITSAAVTSMQFQSSTHRQLLAVGDDQGTVHVMEVPRILRRSGNNEKMFTLTFFEREVKRVEYGQRRAEQRKDEQQLLAEKGEPELEKSDSTIDKVAKEEEMLELAFKAKEETFMEEMGLVEKPKEED